MLRPTPIFIVPYNKMFRMKSSILTAIVALFAATFAISCDESSTVGNVLDRESVVIVVDSNFTINGSTERNPVVLSHTTSQLIGQVDAPSYGSLSSEFVAQFMPSINLDTVGVRAENIDSIKLFMQMERTAFTGDSLVPMGVEVYRLTKDLPYPIYSDFDPAGYYEADPIASAIYTASTANEPDSVQTQTTIAVSMKLPLSLGRDLFNAYMANPLIYSEPEQFAEKVFKGFYFRSSYGSGRITDFSLTSMRTYYHKTEYNTDSARYETNNYVGDYYAVTPEMVMNNTIKYQPAPELEQMIASGEQIIAGPAGYQLELKFPGREVVESYDRYKGSLRVLNSLTFEIPADSIPNKYGITPPPYAMLILKKDVDKFFADNTICDNVTSFYSAYSTYTNGYTFALRGYLNYLLELDTITDDDLTFVLVPVQVNSESAAGSSSSYYYYYGSSSQVVTSIVPYVSTPVMAKISLPKAKIKLTFSAQSGKI